MNMVREDDFNGLLNSMVPLLRSILPEKVLQGSFQMIRLTAGPIVSIGDPVISPEFLVKAVVPIKFERAQLDMTLRLTPAGKIVSLRLSPQHALDQGLSWHPPAYTQPSTFTEVDVKLGKQGFKVPGTLTLPDTVGRHPCVNMLPGSGPCDRDSTVESTKPFKDIAWGLARSGVATLRFDKVTFARRMKVALLQKHFTISDAYMNHALDAVRQSLVHPNVKPKSVFVLGHSLGSLIASRVAATEPEVSGCILLGPPALGLHHSLLKQLRAFAAEDDPSGKTPQPIIDQLARQAEFIDSPDLTLSTPAAELPLNIGPAYWLDLRKYDAIEDCKHLEKPILIMQGATDSQVSLEDHCSKFSKELKGKFNVTTRVYEECNHLFIASKSSLGAIEHNQAANVEKQAVQDIARWVTDHSHLDPHVCNSA